MNRIKPLDKTPSTTVELLPGGQTDLSAWTQARFKIIFFYRGYHCPVCRLYLHDIQVKLNDFRQMNIEVIAVSCDTAERAALARDEWHMPDLTIGYGMDPDSAREWGLYLSDGRGNLEPDLFSEPGIFILNSDGTLYASVIQTMPFSRPSIEQLVKDMRYIIENDYPPRGTH
ncbi:peroxiredoxin-like family protein [Roseivirga sp. BDSF3-8]|uniref:peroxiredoxin-like family protein n=1 Tax=Roseivirga sp. BDSF3-8 TaxID=3241598 RepID=UPI0035322F61